MGHIAFELHTIIDNIPNVKIESVAVWNDTLFIGCQDGSLLTYKVTYLPNSKDGSAKRFNCDLLTVKKDFSKKSVIQLCTVPELGLLISLSDGLVRLHVLTSLREVTTLSNSKASTQSVDGVLKGISLFALKKHRNEYVIALANNKKQITLMNYSSKESTFRQTSELQLPDSAKSINWSGDTICVGFKREYSLVDLNGAPPKTLAPTGDRQLNTYGLTLPDELVVLNNNFSVMMNFEGKPTRSAAIMWTETPLTTAFLKPYLISPLSNSTLEIRILQTPSKKETLIQSIPLPNITRMSQPNYVDLDEQIIDSGMGTSFKIKSKEVELNDDASFDPTFRVFLASKSGIYALCMRNFKLQVLELQSNREYEQALHLCDIVQNTRHEVEKWRINSIRLEYGFHLFAMGEFQKSMLQFNMTPEEDPRIVLSLFPDLLPTPTAGNKSLQIPTLSPEQLSNTQSLLKDDDKKKISLEYLLEFLVNRRIKPHANLTQMELDIAEAVDTAILKAQIYTQDENLIKFLESPNHCHVDDCQRILLQYHKFQELITFFRTKELHEQALQLLKNLSRSESKEMSGVNPTIQYLTQLKTRPDLIMSYSKWVLAQEPLRALGIFTRSDCPIDVYMVLKHLETCDDSISLRISYLEHLIHKDRSTDPELHNRLVLLYLQYGVSPPAHGLFDVNNISQRRKKFLIDSQHYNPEKMLSKFPIDDMFEERAILLSKINRHSQALYIYVHKLRNPDAAEKYCEEHFNDDPNAPEESREIFITLLKMNLQPPENEQPYVNDAIRVLERHFDQIDPIKALRLLPDSIAVQELLKYNEAVIRMRTQLRRQVQVMKNIAKSENFKVQESYISERKRSVKIKVGRMCPVCKKKIGLSAFACYPNGTVVHMVCHKNPNIDPFTGRDFLKDSFGNYNKS
ncbi:vacuolar protein sorting protein VPS39 [Acrasis kona]|uniref:Vacuolar protein sorting protein VPS39 n=1 Tax=Acrasis kona TaxID=1008807 RepID=A0AAW2YVP3_9EUKA